jgi:phosphate transport system permease protein
MFAAIVAIVVINSLPAFDNPGLAALFDTRFVGVWSAEGAVAPAWGLLPALFGTVEITAIALLIALPVALALAIVTTEFATAPVGRVLRPLLGLLSGIPPIVYAISMLVFVQAFMIPKFAANATNSTFSAASIGANPATWPPSGVPFNAGSYPWDLTGDTNSSLLAGILVALLLIPFITPMIADAIRNVPSSAREASLALGANRSYTLRKAILPRAAPAIMSAVMLGTLKAVGDVVIVSIVAGTEADGIPSPLLDIFEHTPGLAAQGANLISPFKTPGAQYSPVSGSVGFLCALVLLVLAALMILLMGYLRERWHRRMGV